MAFKQTINYSGIDAQVNSSGRLLVETNGSVSISTNPVPVSGAVILYATASGTGTITAVLCDVNGILLTSGVN